MAPVPIKRLVYVSSEDIHNPSFNLVRGGSSRKWLTEKEEKARKAEVILELCKKTRIISVEIGNFGSAFIEIHVCCSSSASIPNPSSTEWLTLVPSCMLMTVHDSRAGRNKTSILTVSKERFSATAINQKWNHIKIICRQPYNMSSQFGLQHVAFYSEHTTDISSPLTPSPLHKSPHYHPSPIHHNTETTPHSNKHKLPSLPTSTVTPGKQGEPNHNPLQSKSSKTPKRPLREPNKDESEEFTGIEKQSRLLNIVLKTPSSELMGKTEKTNPILQRIASEHEKKKNMENFRSSYEKKRLLVRELGKAELKNDFASAYVGSKSTEMTAAFRKITQHDNCHEIGQEPEHPFGSVRGRRRGRDGEGGEDGWVRRKKKKLSGMISECRRVLSEAGTAGGTSGKPEDLSSTSNDDDSTPMKMSAAKPPVMRPDVLVDSDSDSDATVIMDYTDNQPPTPPPPVSKPSPVATESSVDCPLCGQSFPTYVIELHAANCNDSILVSLY